MKYLLLSLTLTIAVASNAYAHDDFTRGKAELEMGHYTSAVQLLRSAYQGSSSRSTDLLATFAQALAKSGSLDSAQTIVEQGFDITKKNASLHEAQGDIYLARKQFTKALSEYRSAMKLEPTNARYYVSLANGLVSADSSDAATVVLLKAYDLDRRNINPLIVLGDLYMKQGVYAMAEVQFQNALDVDQNNLIVRKRLAGAFIKNRKYNEALNLYQSIVDRDSTNADAYVEIGEIYMMGAQIRHSQYNNAAVAFAKALRLHPENISVQWNYAEALVKAHRFAEAIPALEKLSVIDSLSKEASLMLGESYFYDKQFQKALDVYSRFSKTPTAEIYDRIGQSYEYLKKPKEAFENYEKALALDSTRIATLSRAAPLAMTQKDFPRAIAYFRKRLAVDTVTSTYYTIHTNIGLSFLSAEEYDSARVSFGEATRLNPEYAEGYSYLGRTELLAKKYDAAVKAYDKYLELTKPQTEARKTQRAEVRAYRGLTKLLLKDCEGAIDDLKESLEAETTDKTFASNKYLWLGQSYQNCNKIEDAKKSYRESLKLDKNNKGTKENLENLEKMKK